MYPSKRIHVAVCLPIGSKFGTHMQIHIEKVVGKIKICPVSPRGNLGVMGGHKLKMWEICQTAGPISTTFGTHMRIHLGMNIRLKHIYLLETPGGILRGLCGQKLKPGKYDLTAGLIAGCCVSLSKPHHK